MTRELLKWQRFYKPKYGHRLKFINLKTEIFRSWKSEHETYTVMLMKEMRKNTNKSKVKQRQEAVMLFKKRVKKVADNCESLIG